MDEKQMLLMAAKAAGYEFGIGYDEHITGPYIIDGHGFPVAWNPIHDDGDALRLAVKLGILVLTARGFAVANATDSGGTCERILSDPDPYAATRLAIVRAAAAIGGQSNG